jgi:hypothetical protein
VSTQAVPHLVSVPAHDPDVPPVPVVPPVPEAPPVPEEPPVPGPPPVAEEPPVPGDPPVADAPPVAVAPPLPTGLVPPEAALPPVPSVAPLAQPRAASETAANIRIDLRRGTIRGRASEDERLTRRRFARGRRNPLRGPDLDEFRPWS